MINLRLRCAVGTMADVIVPGTPYSCPLWILTTGWVAVGCAMALENGLGEKALLNLVHGSGRMHCGGPRSQGCFRSATDWIGAEARAQLAQLSFSIA